MPHDHVQKNKFLTPSNGGACAIHVSNSRTKSGISEFFFRPPTPHGYPQVPPLGMTQAAE